MYYLQSRYYDSAIGRFINADSYTSTGQGILGNNTFIYCNNNPILYMDDSGEFALSTLVVLGAAMGGMVNYAGQVIQNIKAGETGISAFVDNVNWGQVASSSFSGALSVVPGGTFAKTIVDISASVVIEHGVNYLLGAKWDMEQFGQDLIWSALTTVATPDWANVKVPYYIRDIKQEAREMAIKGTKRLTTYLNFKQTTSILTNSFANDTISRTSSGIQAKVTKSQKKPQTSAAMRRAILMERRLTM